MNNQIPTIFVVDDDAAVRNSLMLSLKERKYQVESFESADAILTATHLDRPGCILLDVRMPHLTGLELQDELIARGIAMPIIFLSAFGDVPTSVKAMRKGAIDFLEKPYSMDVMVERIEEALLHDRKARAANTEAKRVSANFERLTDREREVMAMIVAGAATTSNREVADALGISRRTVETYRSRLMEKMQARSLTDLVNMAKACGIYQPDAGTS